MDEEEEREDEKDVIEFINIKGEVEFRNVWFFYKEGEFVLKNISFYVKFG